MIKVNENYAKLQGSYLFSEIARRTAAFLESNPDADLIRLGIGDVTRPLSSTVVSALHTAVDEMATAEGFRGYGPEQGYDFLRSAIANEYAERGVTIAENEIFISDGSKCDTGNIGDILSCANKVAITDPVYPVYVDTNVMAGRTGNYNPETTYFDGMEYLPTVPENGFKPALPSDDVDVLYLCSPNNPTGTALTRADLKVFVDWANAHHALILFDSAYERFITEEDVPHSIFEIEGARTCAIEFRSFSKTAGFTGVRCAYTVVPQELMAYDEKGGEHSLNKLWNRRHTTKFNGTSYIVQRAAEAVFSPEGKAETDATIAYYLNNAAILKEGLESIGIETYGGVNSPYVWLRAPGGLTSWEFFDKFLKEGHMVGTPGAGFGPSGEGFFRLTAFNTEENTRRAIERFGNLKF